MQNIYIETSVVSYYVAERSENIRIAGHQISTIAMWNELHKYNIYISGIVVEEASHGHSKQAELRLIAIKDFHILTLEEKATKLAQLLLSEKAIPTKYPEDALHIAIAAVNDIDFIVTWNFKHINNPFTKNKIRFIIEKFGCTAPVMCSPEELLGENYE